MKQRNTSSGDRRKKYYKGKERPNKENGRNRENKRDEGRYNGKVDGANEILNPSGRNNDPNWYFTDATLAEQVSQLAFQNLAGYPINFEGQDMDVPNIVRIQMNPSPGVIRSADYNSPGLNKTSGINLAGFKIFSKISAFTGRIASYGPQDISVMLLAFGELISCVEWCRRCFGIANASSMRNRDYPREALSWGCCVDDDDFFKNYANYRTRFNSLITMVNQLPIPKGIAYFDKCASLYEKVYLDSPSSMAQSIILNPHSTWILDEASNPSGTQLVTTQWMCSSNTLNTLYAPRLMSDYLDTLDSMISTMLNSSTLQTVYTDLLNLSVKVGQEFWKFDYLVDGYLVIPEYNANMLLQMHNATICGVPSEPAELTAPEHVTALNDVVPNPVTNSLFYNPGFTTVNSVNNGYARTGSDVLVDMLSDAPSVEDRVECTRYTAISGQKAYTGASSNPDHRCDGCLPDHYAVYVGFKVQDPNKQNVASQLHTTILGNSLFPIYASYISNIDWAPRIWELDTNNNILTGNYIGDINFYTVVNEDYLRKLHQFMTLGLYDLRSHK